MTENASEENVYSYRHKQSSYEEVDINQLRREVSDTALKIDDIRTLQRFTDESSIKKAGGDLAEHVKSEEEVLSSLDQMPDTYYQELIFALIQIRLPEEEAKSDWKKILSHKADMSRKLGRNPGIHVATLDYFTNIKRRLSDPKIMSAREYADTASKALCDNLTKAYNRDYMQQELKRLFLHAKAEGRCFSLLMLDLDHFKTYNDVNGHVKGDIALIQLVKILHAVCSAKDTVARYGGEEFTVLLPDKGLAEAQAVAEGIHEAVFEFRFVNEQCLPNGRLSLSIGISSYRMDIKAPNEVLEEADVALYRAKGSGRNTIKAFLSP